MAIRKIEVDEDANQILESMANAYGGNASLAVSELLRAYETIESSTSWNPAKARNYRIRKSRPSVASASWQEVKRENGV